MSEAITAPITPRPHSTLPPLMVGSIHDKEFTDELTRDMVQLGNDAPCCAIVKIEFVRSTRGCYGIFHNGTGFRVGQVNDMILGSTDTAATKTVPTLRYLGIPEKIINKAQKAAWHENTYDITLEKVSVGGGFGRALGLTGWRCRIN